MQEDLVIYEMHVRGFTHAAPDVKAAGAAIFWTPQHQPLTTVPATPCRGNHESVLECTIAGTYSGIVEKLNYLKRLGVNAIELLPVHEFNELEYYKVRKFTIPACFCCVLATTVCKLACIVLVMVPSSPLFEIFASGPPDDPWDK